MESPIMKTYKSILTGEMPYVRTHIELDKDCVSFELGETEFFFHEADGPIPMDLPRVEQAWLFMTCKGKEITKEITFVNRSKEILQCKCDVPYLRDLTSFVSRWSWTVYVAFKIPGEYKIYRLREIGEDRSPTKRGRNLFYDRQNQYYAPHEEFCLSETDMISMFYITIKGNYALLVTEKEKRYMTQLVLTCKKMKFNSKGISLVVESEHLDKNWKGFYLSYRSEKKEERARYWFPLKKIRSKKDGKQNLYAFLNVKDFEFKPLIWYLSAVFEEDGQTYRVNVKIGIKEFNLLFCGFWGNHFFEDGDNHVMFPFRTQSGSIALKMRQRTQRDSMKVRMRERLAIRCYRLVRRSLEKRNIYFVYEKYCEMAQDNGYYFFKYCMEHQMEKEMGSEIYYIIDDKAPDYQKLKQYGDRVIPFLSFRYFLYMMAAKVLISSDNKLHAFIWNPMPSLIPEVIARKNHVFLQHGVTALKVVKNVFDRNGKFATDLFIVTSEQEKKIISKFYHYTEEEIAVTGFARWDVLRDKSDGRREILVMPTWRKGLDSVSDEEFCRSEYFTKYKELINSERLQAILSEHGATMCFYIHPKMRQFFSHFTTDIPNVTLVSFSEMPLNELLMRCKLLVTDYSSVSWDVFYQSKPVLFYQFDLEQYNETNGSFIDMEKDLFGDRTTKLDELLDLVEENITNGFQLKDEYRSMLKDSFAYIDNENSKRICEAINSKEWVVKTERRYI